MAEPAEPSSNNSETVPRDEAILSEHLDPQFTASLHDETAVPDPEARSTASGTPEPQSSLLLQGGDMHRDLYRLDAKTKRARLYKRANTFSAAPRRGSEHDEEGISTLEPGSFRRQYIRQNLDQDHPALRRSFLEYLDLYGHFAGEDLEETETESSAESVQGEEEEEEEHPEPERRPLLGPPRHKRTRSARPGDASNVKTFFTLLKAFIGTGIIFLPKAFRNGGILFSSVTLVTVAIISTVCFHLLLQCRRQYGGGYGDLGERIAGPKFRSVILASVAISQLGFVCACIIFTAENLRAFFLAVTPTTLRYLSTDNMIGVQLLVLIPLALIRNISKLGPVALVADAFILFGLGYIYFYDIASLAARGIGPGVELFNSSSFTLTIGSCIFTFEGIGLILPIQSSMKRPQSFDRLLYAVMAIITVLFTAVGALSYSAFGQDTQTEIFTNLPQDSPLVNTIQFLYSLAILVGTPIQLFPAVRIGEGWLLGHASGKQHPRTKWKKNAFRTAAVLLCGVIAALGAGDLDKFVSIIGSFACVPLVYIYPAWLHYKGVADSPWVKRGDIAMVILGFGFMIYTTSATISVWVSGS
ncbi:amino acid transporter [Aspergillus pseudoustus]|uniref:Amino acid transporter n=1 Tax=Aspergillus pseudoustus TaxID=1810923 RepID=A0ABR4IU40_9EURO